ncbi:hypothetical protein FA13DRAFT_677020 [Coprinellus micaceus]|uniref:Uncharacterized protein n=1 Tax=Coprinellus micaceus TaxID=71717 RepID=A0A4Y7SBL1_COPMI|nr:hypothetical protein FA13DRAFT_677020 [Coprinellus micaceus]
MSTGATLTYTGGGQVAVSLIAPAPSNLPSVSQTTPSRDSPSVTTLLECYGAHPKVTPAGFTPNPEEDIQPPLRTAGLLNRLWELARSWFRRTPLSIAVDPTGNDPEAAMLCPTYYQ